jgi:hypothetical protein
MNIIFYTYHLDTLYLCEQGYEDPWLFCKAKMGPQAKNFGKHWIKQFCKLKGLDLHDSPFRII